MNSEEAIICARIMREAAERNSLAADRIETAVHKVACLFEDGYGGNGLKLIEILSQPSETQQELDRLRGQIATTQDWMRKAKIDAGFHPNMSFDVVWESALKALKESQNK